MKIAIVVSNIDRWMTFEWIADRLKEKHDVHWFLLNPGESYFEDYLTDKEIPFTRINYAGKSQILTRVFALKSALRDFRADIIHCHFLDANIIGLLAGFLAGIKKRIYTRHHSVFHLRYHKKGKLYDRLSNWLSTDIIAISGSVASILRDDEGVPAKKIQLLHHGFELKLFDNPSESNFKERYGIGVDKKIVGVISRYIHWKGVKYIVRAFREFYANHPESMLVLLNARGPDEQEIKKELKLLEKGSFIEIPFEKNITEVFRQFHVFVHAPIDEEVEAFGQVYIEALASGVPCVFTKSGIANDIIEHEQNALVADFRDAKSIKDSMIRLWDDIPLRERLNFNGKETVKAFGIDDFCEKLNTIYEA